MNIQKELIKFFESEIGQQMVGQIVLNAVNQALTRDVRFEDGKSEPGRVVEKTETRNILDHLAFYLPHVEAAIRGCQADSAGARNRSSDLLNFFAEVLHPEIAHSTSRELKKISEK